MVKFLVDQARTIQKKSYILPFLFILGFDYH